MNKQLCLAMMVSVVVLFSIIPAYAEVTSLKIDAPFYKGGSVIHFSGTTADTDPSNITIILFDPNGQFILLTSGLADSNHNFQASIDTGNPSNQQKFSVKGTYNATAFIANKENGKTISFIFSPDGSPVVPSPPTSLTASIASSSEIDLHWSASTNTGGTTLSGYRVDRSADNGVTWTTVAPNVINTVTSYPDTGLTSGTLYEYRVLAVNAAGTSSPSNIVTATTLSASTPTTPSTTTPTNPSSPSLDEILKKRLEDAKRLQEILNGKPSTPSNVQQTVSLSESISVNDISSTLQNSINTSENNLPHLEIGNWNNVLYPLISLVGVGIVVGILYLRKKQKISINNVKKEIMAPSIPTAVPSEKQDEDYAMMILKNRLAKGEITLEQFKEIKDELLEP